MITLKKWFYHYGRRPLGWLSLLLILSVTLFQLREWKDTRAYQQRGVEHLSQMVGVGLAQKNRVLIESLLEASLWQYKGRSAQLCFRGEVIVQEGLVSAPCNDPGSFRMARVLVSDVPGFDGYSVQLIVPAFPQILETGLIAWVGLVLVISYFFILNRIRRKFSTDILQPLEAGLSEDKEIQIIELEKIRKSLLDAMNLKVRQAVSDALVARSLQVSHDIRSPLASLQVVIQNAKGLDAESRRHVSGAVTRIRAIANDLLATRREVEPAQTITPSLRSSESREPAHLMSLIDSVVTQARAQFADRSGLIVEWSGSEDRYPLFAEIQALEFSRLLSNLIGNAVEASDDRGVVRVQLERSEDLIEVSIEDRGRGIPPEVLARLGESGVTHGKRDGNGLGVYHAKTTVESWGGSFEVHSQLEQGTRVTIRIAAVEAPKWFVQGILVSPATTLVIVDDDPALHEFWTRRLEPLKKASPLLQQVHLFSPAALREWYRTEFLAVDGDVLFLCDQEFSGERETGMDSIETLGISAQSILVTGRAEEEEIRQACLKKGVRLLSKAVLKYVPIRLSSSVEPPSESSLRPGAF